MSALSKLSTMNRPLVGADGLATGGGAGSTLGGSGARGPTETGGTGGGTGGGDSTVTVGGGSGPTGGVAILGAGLRVAHPATRESRTALATNPLTLLLRRIAHAGWQSPQQIRRKRTASGNDGRRYRGRRLRRHPLRWYADDR